MKKKYTGRIRFLAHGKSEDGKRFVKLEIQDIYGGVEQTLLRLDDLHKRQSEEFIRLNRLGANLITPAAQRELLERLQTERVATSDLTVATRLGWVNGAYVLPEQIIGLQPQRLELYLCEVDEACLGKFLPAGTLKKARQVAKLARGNSRLMLALSIALVGTLGGILPLQQVGIQFFGAPGSAKTAVAAIASSIWGWNPDPNIGDELGCGDLWNNTLANLERIAPLHQHGFVLLDGKRKLMAAYRESGVCETLSAA